jgi:ADP-heptose:LPS heptosyltransferase
VPGIDQIHMIDTRELRCHPTSRIAWHRLKKSLGSLRARHYDVSIDFQGLIKTAMLSLASGARVRLGFAKELVREPPAHWFYHRTLKKPALPMHVVRLNQLLAQETGARPGTLQVNLQPAAGDELAIEELLRLENLSDFLVINPGGGWPNKLWHPARYGDLAARIEKELAIRVAVTTGPDEDLLYDQMAANCAHEPPVHLRVPFLQLVPLYRRSRLVIGGDTGPLHLACALGTPVVAVMGPTFPVRNGPWSAADESVTRQLPCSYCNQRSCPTATECMDIGVEEVFSAVVRRLERTS